VHGPAARRVSSSTCPSHIHYLYNESDNSPDVNIRMGGAVDNSDAIAAMQTANRRSMRDVVLAPRANIKFMVSASAPANGRRYSMTVFRLVSTPFVERDTRYLSASESLLRMDWVAPWGRGNSLAAQAQFKDQGRGHI